MSDAILERLIAALEGLLAAPNASASHVEGRAALDAYHAMQAEPEPPFVGPTS